jgi:membrane-bound lytic murein transglycosylase B
MSHRSPLKGGAPRLLGHHGGAMGKAYRRVYDALESEFGPFTVLQRLEAGRVAVCYVQLEAATNALVDAQRQRRHGKGRRPNLEQIERLARRQGLADGSYSQALDKLKELTAANRKRQPASGRELLERVRAGGGA